jgi:hypothetical protein
MKKLLMILLLAVTSIFADVKLDVMVSARRMGCYVTKWVQNDYVGHVKWQYYAQITCKDPINVPAKIVGLKFIDIERSAKGEYVYTYGND